MSLVNGKGDRQAAWFGVDDGGPAGGGFVGVVLNRPVDQVFTYRLPERLRGLTVPGARVRVPLGRGNTPAVGYCVRLDDAPGPDVDPGRVKDVIEVLDDPPLIDAAMLDLTRWIAGYYACSWGQALDAVVPAGVKKGAGTRVTTCLVVPDEVRAAPEPADLTSKQAELFALIRGAEHPPTLQEACRLARCGTAPVAALRKRGLIRAVKRRTHQPKADDAEPRTPAPAPPEPTPEQAAALAELRPALQAGGFATYLLHGVTGSGKTEVYLSAIEEVVARGREAIVLVPEISLTPQTIRRFRRRFPRVAVLHSHLADSERHRHWRSIAAGEIQVVVGARSAVFAPTRRLGLIVIDEEHESTFKQETVPRYHARDVAVKRAHLEGVPVLLGSATPALETWQNAESGRYRRITLAARVAERPMPEVTLIDLRHQPPRFGALSMPLRVAMAEALDDGGQVILLLNRRGFHTFVVCPKCGAVLKCRACDIALTYHKGRQRLICHTCDAERERPPACPECQAANLYYGGIGTERLEREVFEAFPDQTIRRMDSDTMRSPGSHEQVLAAFKAGEIRILLGTQMIAKGLDFPDVTLVGVVNADTALHLPDFRAAERTFQLVAQVAGRTGRGDRPGRVLVQTFCPDHPAIRHAAGHDYLGFVAEEIPRRLESRVPPFGRLVRLIARGPDEPTVQAFLDAVADRLRAIPEVAAGAISLQGPAPAPVLKIKNLYRYHLRLRADTPGPLRQALRTALHDLSAPSGVELAVDVDPVSML